MKRLKFIIVAALLTVAFNSVCAAPTKVTTFGHEFGIVDEGNKWSCKIGGIVSYSYKDDYFNVKNKGYQPDSSVNAR